MVSFWPNGSPGVGPTWKDAWGVAVALADGTKIPADDEAAWLNYVMESIRKPSAQIHAGFPSPSPMPLYNFTDEELVRIDKHAKDSGINLWKASSDR